VDPPSDDVPPNVTAVDMTAVDLLCRMQLVAMRLGCRVLLDDPAPELLAVIRFAGLDEVLPVASPCPTCRSQRSIATTAPPGRPP
jgi:hypothetical protein